MTAKSIKLNVSLLPVILLVLIAVGAGYFLMQGEFKLPKIFNRDPEVRRLKGFPTLVDVSDEIDKQRAVIKNAAELKAFLATADKKGGLVLTENINFDNEYLIGVSSTTQNIEGRQIRIKKLYQDKNDNSLLVQIEQTEMANICKVEPRNYVLVDLVAVSKTDKKIGFEVVKKIDNDCAELKTPKTESTDSITK